MLTLNVRCFLLLLLVTFGSVLPAQNDSIVKRGKKYVYKGEHKLFRTRYDSIRNFSEGYAAVKRKDKWGFIKTDGEQLVSPYYESVQDFNAGLAPVKSRSDWTLMDKKGQRLTYRTYDTILFIDSLAIGVHVYFELPESRKIDVFHAAQGSNCYSEANLVTSCGNGYLLTYENQYCNSYDRRAMQVINRNGSAITPKFVWKDSVGVANVIIASCNRKEALLTKDLKLSAWYDDVEAPAEQFFVVKNNYAYGVINNRGAEIIQATYSSIRKLQNNFVVGRNKEYFLADTNGQIVAGAYAYIDALGNGVFKAGDKISGSSMLITESGDTLAGNYSTVYGFQSGVARVVNPEGTHFGYIDTSGNLISGWYPRAVDYHAPETYNDVGGTIFRVFLGIMSLGISEAFEPVQNMGGEQTISEHHTTFYGADFVNGYSLYTKKRKAPSPNTHHEEPVYYGVIDSTGKEVVNAVYSGISFADTFFIVSKNGNFGIVDRSGKEILKPSYGSAKYIGDGFFDIGTHEWNDHAIYDATRRKFITSFNYDKITLGGDSTLIVEDWPKRGYINYDGTRLTPMNFHQAYPFENGRAKVSYDYSGHEFYIDRKGQRIK